MDKVSSRSRTPERSTDTGLKEENAGLAEPSARRRSNIPECIPPGALPSIKLPRNGPNHYDNGTLSPAAVLQASSRETGTLLPNTNGGTIYSPHEAHIWLVPVSAPRTKRRRFASDVDGPLTAELSCKKRRLRTHLITSRLSQPFSHPATHILNRESWQGGSVRLAKRAARARVTAPTPHLRSMSMLRFSVMNSLRKRGVGCCLVETERDCETVAQMPPRPDTENIGSSKVIRTPNRSVKHGPSTVSLTRNFADLLTVDPNTRTQGSIAQQCKMSPASWTYSSGEEEEEDGFAFLHLPDGDWEDEDVLEHVYSDFEVIFAGASSADAAERSYDEYSMSFGMNS